MKSHCNNYVKDTSVLNFLRQEGKGLCKIMRYKSIISETAGVFKGQLYKTDLVPYRFESLIVVDDKQDKHVDNPIWESK